MGLNTFSTALSGLDSSTMGLNVVGNNLANLNTVGFKESNITFSEVLGQQFSTPGGNLNHIGLGSQVQAIREEFSQGSVQSSNNPLDVAIQGQGMLILDDNGSRAYSRAGNMHLDSNGNLVAGAGANIQGYLRDAVTGLINRAAGLQDIVIPNNLVAPTPTTEFELGMNLDAAAATGAPFSSTIQLFDSQGTSHLATLSMVKAVTGGATPVTRWRYDITIPTDEIAGSTP
ncbi:MAG TPA: flagellar hook-basal body complex protein, partial [Terriglobia bacterium]|nr:flagellar hook-basal body complex protein [Terriglobia bacterium]